MYYGRTDHRNIVAAAEAVATREVAAGVAVDQVAARVLVALLREAIGDVPAAVAPALLGADASAGAVPRLAADPAVIHEALTGRRAKVMPAGVRLEARDRKARGVYYTPSAVARVLADIAIGDETRTVCDPACGAGALLLAALDRSPDLRVTGVDRDPIAADLCRIAIWRTTGRIADIRCADSLLDPPDERFDAVISNPPFGNAIETLTARDPARAAALAARFPDLAVGAYDLATLFAGLATRLARPGGRIALVMPRVVLGGNGGAPLRRLFDRVAPPTHLWCPEDARLFPGADVFVAVVGAGGVGDLCVATKSPPAWRVVARPAGEWWPAIHGGPVPGTSQPLGAVAEVWAGSTTAAAYELASVVVEDGGGPRLVTAGLIDRYVCHWGRRPARFLGRRFATPRWPAEAPAAVARARDRQRQPKILVAGLSRVIEAVDDPLGELAGVVGTLVVRPPGDRRDTYPDGDRRALLAVLNSPAFSFFYWQRFGAKQLSGGNCTIGKRELLAAPVPVDLAGLDGDDGPDLHAVISDRYGLTPAEHAEVVAWWSARLPKVMVRTPPAR